MNKNLVKIEINDFESLLKACDLLHDARCELSLLQFNETEGILKARFEREFFEDKELIKTKSILFGFAKTTYPVAGSELILKGIKSFKTDDKSQVGKYTFNECKVTGNTITLSFCEDMNIILSFIDRPNGSLTDHKLLEKEVSYYHLYNLFGISNAN